MTGDDRGFGSRLAGSRRLAGLSQQELAERSGLSVRTIGNLERGRARWPHPDTVRRLADALDLRGEARDKFMVGADRRLAGSAADGAESSASAFGDQSSPAAGPGAPVPQQLPHGVRHFTGRKAELAVLAGLLDAPGTPDGSGTVVISAIGGTAGVGKTALAIHWAHQAAGRFGDGQLYVNMRGFDPSGIPVTPAEAIRGFLDALGVPPGRIPADEDAQAGLYRSLLADRKVLIVLDNARDEAQVRPLLPANPASVVIITSRNQLGGLAAADGARLLSLDLLNHDEAVQLLSARIGAQRAAADPEVVGEIAALCACLPLALAVAAAQAAARPGIPLRALSDELRDTAGRLDVLDAGDPVASVTAVFSWSYRQLSGDAARMFRLLGLHPGPDISVRAAASLAAVDEPHARRLLREMARDCMISEHAPGRYAFHDLLRAYAAGQARRCDSQPDRDTAIGRVLDHYLHTASVAMDTLHPAERHRRPRIAPPDTPIPSVADPATARTWLDAERATLAALTVHAARHGWPGHAIRLSSTLFRYLDTGGHYLEAITIHSHARTAAQHIGDRVAEAGALQCLGGVHWRQSRHQQAADNLQQALTLFRQAGDRGAQARALGNFGLIRDMQGNYLEAISLHSQALAIYRETGDQYGKVRALTNLGVSEERLGRYDLAARDLLQALAIAADIGAQDMQCVVLPNLGTVGLRQGRYRQAAGHLHQALALSREIGYRETEAEALVGIGSLCLLQGRSDEAARQLRKALAVYRELGSPPGEAEARNSLGEVLAAAGQPDLARAEYDAALALAAQTGDKYQQARAHQGLGQACHVDDDPSEGRRHWQQALDLFTELGTPEAGQVRARLAACDGSHQKQDDRQPGQRRRVPGPREPAHPGH